MNRDLFFEQGEEVNISVNVSPAEFEEGDGLYLTIKQCYNTSHNFYQASVTDVALLNTNPINFTIPDHITAKMCRGRYVYAIYAVVNGGQGVPLLKGNIRVSPVALPAGGVF